MDREQGQKEERASVSQSVDQTVDKIIGGRLKRIDEIKSEMTKAKKKIVLTVLISLLLFTLFPRNEIFWIPFCIVGFYTIVTIGEYRYLRGMLLREQELEENTEFLKSIKASS